MAGLQERCLSLSLLLSSLLPMKPLPEDCAQDSLVAQARDEAVLTWTQQILLRPFRLPRAVVATTTRWRSQTTRRRQSGPAQSRSSSHGVSGVHVHLAPQRLLHRFLSAQPLSLLLSLLLSSLWAPPSFSSGWWKQERFWGTTRQVSPCVFSASCVHEG